MSKRSTTGGQSRGRVATALFYMAALFILSTLPDERTPLRDFFVFNVKVTNLLHVPAFTVLFILWFRVGKARYSGSGCVTASIVSFSYGVFIELYQFFVPGRFPSVGDIALNASGIVVGLLIVRRLLPVVGAHC